MVGRGRACRERLLSLLLGPPASSHAAGHGARAARRARGELRAATHRRLCRLAPPYRPYTGGNHPPYGRTAVGGLLTLYPVAPGEVPRGEPVSGGVSLSARARPLPFSNLNGQNFTSACHFTSEGSGRELGSWRYKGRFCCAIALCASRVFWMSVGFLGSSWADRRGGESRSREEEHEHSAPDEYEYPPEAPSRIPKVSLHPVRLKASLWRPQLLPQRSQSVPAPPPHCPPPTVASSRSVPCLLLRSSLGNPQLRDTLRGPRLLSVPR